MRAAASMWRLLLPTEIRSSGDGSSFNVGIANAREMARQARCESKKAGIDVIVAVQMLGNQCMSEEHIKRYGWFSLKIDRLQH